MVFPTYRVNQSAINMEDTIVHTARHFVPFPCSHMNSSTDLRFLAFLSLWMCFDVTTQTLPLCRGRLLTCGRKPLNSAAPSEPAPWLYVGSGCPMLFSFSAPTGMAVSLSFSHRGAFGQLAWLWSHLPMVRRTAPISISFLFRRRVFYCSPSHFNSGIQRSV